MKKVIGLFTALVVFTSMSFAAKSAKKNELSVWSYTDDLQTIIYNYYCEEFNSKIDYSITPVDSLLYKLDYVLKSKNEAADVFTLDDGFVREYVEQGDKYLLDLTDVYNEVKDKLIKYPVQIGTNNGKVYALSWQAAPGAMFYRRSLAKKYLGTDDPEEVQNYFSNWDNFLNTAVTLKEKSNGQCVVTASPQELYRAYLGCRKKPWVVKGQLTVDSAMVDYMKMCKQLKDKGLVGDYQQWTEDWFSGMKGTYSDELKTQVEVFSYFLPTWGLHYILKPNAPYTVGDWAMIQGPSAWSWGGTWIAGNKNTKNPEGVKHLIKYICSNDSFLERWANDTGDIVSNNKVIEKISTNYAEPFLDGQNHYKAFAEYANKVNGSLTQASDFAIESLWHDVIVAYMNEEMSLEQALADFKDKVNKNLGF